MRYALILSVAILSSALSASTAGSLAWITEAGGIVTRDTRGRVIAVDLRASWAGDSDLASLAQASTLRKLDLSETRISDHGLRQLKNATGITDLNLRYAELITDEGISALKNWNHLTRLNLEGTKITDSALQHLSTLTSLEALNIGKIQVTDAGLQAITSLTNLKELTLGGDKLTDAGLQSLRELPGLTLLDLGGTQRQDSGIWSVSFTQPGLESIAGLKYLRCLRLDGTLLSARGLETIKGLSALELLDLHGCVHIGDDAVPILAAMRSMRFLDLTGTHVSASAIEELRRKRPDCRIYFAAAETKPAVASAER